MSDQDIKSIAREMSMADTEGSAGMDTVPDLLNWNNLAYTMPITNSVTSARNMKEYKPQRREYKCIKNDTIILVVETGAQYVDWRHSYLTFDLVIEKNDDFGANSAEPMISVHDSGAEDWSHELISGTSDPVGGILTETVQANPSFASEVQNDYTTRYVAPVENYGDISGTDYLTPHLWFNWGYGSCKNLFRSMVVTSRSGVELQRTEAYNRYSVCKDRVEKSPSWFETIGVEMGYEPIDEHTRFDSEYGLVAHSSLGSYESDQNKYGLPYRLQSPFVNKKSQFVFKTAASTSTNKVSFSIPMSCFGGIFDTGQLCPASICSGMRIELRLEDIKTAMIAYGAYYIKWGDTGIQTRMLLPTRINTALEGTISNMRLNCDTHLLNDAAMRELNRTSAQNGLEYVYTSTFGQAKPLQSGTIDVTVAKSVSRAISAMGGCFTPYKSDTGVDNFTTAPPYDVNLSQYQWRLGSMYFPHAPFTSYAQFYSNLLYSAGQYSESKCDLSPSEFKSLLTLFSATFERSNLLRYSGVPINNSRTLSCTAEFKRPGYDFGGDLNYGTVDFGDIPSEKNYTVHVWLDYVTLAKAFLNNIVVSV